MTGARMLRSAADLVAAGLADSQQLAELEAVGARYAIGVTPAMQVLIDPTDQDDPIARQFLPDSRELMTLPEERDDPIGDLAHSPVAGIVHRYADRVLLKVVHVCPVYCRFCFRREMVGPAGLGTLSGPQLEEAIAYISAHPEIWEVILTGGDPLVLSPRRLREVMAQLSVIPHLRVVRLHSRVPVVDPAHIDTALIEALTASGKTVYLAIHANHEKELTAAAERTIRDLADAGIALVSQTVLLRGVNDDAAVLARLMRRFVEMRIKPYYLHHPDLAPGTAHFRLPLSEGQLIFEELRRMVSGLCVPTYVLDLPGGFGKVPASASSIDAKGDDTYSVRDRKGVLHAYPPAGMPKD